MSIKEHHMYQVLFGEKMDGVIEAVHYGDDGLIDWVRCYQRRGPSWSDRVLINREVLVSYLEAGERIFIGDRIENEASEFTLREKVIYDKSNNVVYSEGKPVGMDHLDTAPVL
jgi:hypothetical protein